MITDLQASTHSKLVLVGTWLKHRQAPVCVSKHQFPLLGGVPSEETDVRQEGVGFFMHRDPRIGTSVDPDVQRTALGDERHSVSRVPAPTD